MQDFSKAFRRRKFTEDVRPRITEYTSYFRVTAFLKPLADLIKCGSLSSYLMNVSVGDVEVKAGL